MKDMYNYIFTFVNVVKIVSFIKFIIKHFHILQLVLVIGNHGTYFVSYI